MIVVVEGMTNAGKSTACRYAEELLRGRNVSTLTLVTSDDLVIGSVSQITNPVEHAAVIDDRSELLLYAAILRRKRELIVSTRASVAPDVLLVDRFALSVLCFFTYVRRLPRQAVSSLVDFCLDGLSPDLTVFLDVSFATASARSATSPFSRKDLGIRDYWDALRSGFLTELSRSSTRTCLVNGESADPHAIAVDIVSHIDAIRLPASSE